jgi:uncharacterized protein (DUF58 family)
MKRRLPQKRRGFVKWRGWLVIAIAIGFLLFGLAFGLAEYFIAAAVCLFLLLIATAQAVGQCPLLKLDAGSAMIVRGQTRLVWLKVTNTRPWPFFPLRLRLSLQKEGQEPQELAYFEIALKPWEEKRLDIEIVCPHRGEYAIFLHQYYAEDIFGFFALPRPALPVQRLLSLPQLDLSSLAEQENAAREEEEIKQGRQWLQGQLTAESRTYLQGDTLSAIHWKKSASRRELFSRLREHTADYSCCMLMDNRPLGEGEEALSYEDRLCEAAFSFLFTQLIGHQPMTLLPGSQTLQTAQNLEKAAEWLATLPFSAEAVLGELKTLLENRQPPTELYLALAQTPTPLFPLLEQIVNLGCRVTLLIPMEDADLVKGGFELLLPAIIIDPPRIDSPWLEV